MDDTTNKLRITGLKEPVVWIKDEKGNKPIAWMAGVGIEGLIPDPFKGYKFKYTIELVSHDGQILNTGILSQTPGYMGTSTTVAIGGMDLPAGNYTARIRGDNGEEDTMAVTVPDYETWAAQNEQESKQKDAQIKPKGESVMNNELEFVNEVYLEEDADSILLTVERKDHTKHSVVLREPMEALHIDYIPIDDATINKIKNSLAIWEKKPMTLLTVTSKTTDRK
jgi:hypothetical protein